MSAAASDDPWLAVAAALEAAKKGDSSGIAHLRRWVLDEQVAPTLAGACLDLMADAGRRDDLEFLAGLMLEGSDALRLSACEVAQWCGMLWLVPYMLEARKAVRRLTEQFNIHQDGVHHRGPGRRSCLTFMVYLTTETTSQEATPFSTPPGREATPRAHRPASLAV